MVAEGHLRHHDDEWPAIGMQTYRLGQTDLRLVHALRPALARAVQKENHRPLGVLIPVLGNIDLVLVSDTVHRYMAIQKACVRVVVRKGVHPQRRDKEYGGCNYRSCTAEPNHCRPEYREFVWIPQKHRRSIKRIPLRRSLDPMIPCSRVSGSAYCFGLQQTPSALKDRK